MCSFNRTLPYTNLHTFSFQLTQLWICDWLLEIRTTLWQDLSQDAEFEKSISSMSLAGFQRDLACLRQLCQHIPVSINSYTGGVWKIVRSTLGSDLGPKKKEKKLYK